MKLDLVASEYAVALIDMLAATGGHRATKVVDEKTIVRATRIKYKKGRKFGPNFEIVLSAGKPNYRERELIKHAKKANRRFPLSIRVQY